jgi:hypothetical protein
MSPEDIREEMNAIDDAWNGATIQTRIVAQLAPIDGLAVEEWLDEKRQMRLKVEPHVIIGELVSYLTTVIATGDRMRDLLAELYEQWGDLADPRAGREQIPGENVPPLRVES